MVKKLPSLSIFFPFYNEEANIAAQVEEALKSLLNLPKSGKLFWLMTARRIRQAKLPKN